VQKQLEGAESHEPKEPLVIIFGVCNGRHLVSMIELSILNGDADCHYCNRARYISL